jgi:dTMP kinase
METQEMYGKFIALEGVDYAGKTDKIAHLQRLFSSDQVLFTKEPGGTENGLILRQLLLGGAPDKEQPWDWKTQLLLFFADRNQHLIWKVHPARACGVHVITDRFRASSLAYNVPEHSLDDLVFFDMLSRSIVGEQEPTLYIFLNLPVEVALARAQERLEQQNHFDTASLDVYAKRHRMYQKFFTQLVDPDRVCIIDANREHDLVRADVEAAVREHCDL